MCATRAKRRTWSTRCFMAQTAKIPCLFFNRNIVHFRLRTPTVGRKNFGIDNLQNLPYTWEETTSYLRAVGRYCILRCATIRAISIFSIFTRRTDVERKRFGVTIQNVPSLNFFIFTNMTKIWNAKTERWSNGLRKDIACLLRRKTPFRDLLR